MATKKNATANVHSSNSVKQATATTASSTQAPPNALCSGVCWITALGNTNSATYQNCISQCMGQGEIAPTGPAPAGSNTNGGSTLPIGNLGSTNFTQLTQDMLIRAALIIVGTILVIIGITKMFGGNKQFNIQLQPPDRPHRFGGAPPPPPPTPPRTEIKSMPPIRTQSGPYRGAPGTVPRSEAV